MNQSPHPQHADQGAYRSCKHPDCRAYRERYRKRWAYEREHGQKRTIDSAEARRKVSTLIGLGWSQRSVAGAAGVSPQVITRLKAGQDTVTRKIADRILAIDVDEIPSTPSPATTEVFVSRVGTQRRVQALLYMGWTHDELSARSGTKTSALIHQAGRWVTRTTHDRIARLYDEIAMIPGPSSRTKSRAIARGYLGPLHWDDIDRDAEPILDNEAAS